MRKFDLDIVKELSMDPQAPFSRIGKKLGISPETVRKRYGKMRRKGEILVCSISIDLSKLGYQATAFLWIKNAPNHDRGEVMEFLEKTSNVYTITEITGEFSVFANAAVKDLKDLVVLVNEISMQPAVSRIEFALSDKPFFPLPKQSPLQLMHSSIE